MNPPDPEIPHIMLKLINGESIICTIVSDSNENMIVRDAMQIHLRSDMLKQGIHTYVYYTRWFFSTESTVHLIRKDHIVSAALPSQTMTTDYLDMISGKKEPQKNEGPTSWPDNLNFKIDPKTRFDS